MLLFDPLANTNKYGHQLSCFVTVDADGSTQILAFVITEDKTEETYLWAFKCFATHFRLAPTMVGSDGEVGIINAFAKLRVPGSVWESCEAQILCIFHLSKTFWEHIHPLFTGNKEGWTVTANLFWRTVKQSDVRTIATWEQDSSKLVELVRTTAKECDSASKALDWLTGLMGQAERFAYPPHPQHLELD